MTIETLAFSARRIIDLIARNGPASGAIETAERLAARLTEDDSNRAKVTLQGMLKDLGLALVADQGALRQEWNGPTETLRRQSAALQGLIKALK
jgi:hypothetical protein